MPNNDSSQDGVVLAIDLLLVAHGKTRKWLAEQVGKDQFWIGHRMNNRTMFKFAEVGTIAAVFGLSVEEFLSVPEAIPGARLPEKAAAS
ncbi:hypothetical protein PQI23_08490 [Leucobacter sp. USCH14]|uniref:hypothetical protein n=1 Tax=Leucobacter sp. USCH14 TaxID=3024838 RepID=UPI00309563E7